MPISSFRLSHSNSLYQSGSKWESSDLSLSAFFSRLSRFPSRSCPTFASLSLPCATVAKKPVRPEVKPVGFDTLDDARSVFDDMLHQQPLPSLPEFCWLFHTIARMNHHSTVISMSRELEFAGIKHNIYSLSMLLNCFSHFCRLGVAYSILGKMFKLGLQASAITFTSLINGLCLGGKIVKLVRLLDEMMRMGCQPDLITYNTIVNGLCKIGDNCRALKVLRKMEERSFLPNVVTFNTIVDSLCKDKLITDAENLLLEMIGKGIQPNVVTYNSFVHGMCNAGQQNESAKLLNEMVAKGINPDVVTFNIFIDSLCKVGDFLRLKVLF